MSNLASNMDVKELRERIATLEAALKEIALPAYLGNENGIDTEVIARELNRRQQLAKEVLKSKSQESSQQASAPVSSHIE